MIQARLDREGIRLDLDAIEIINPESDTRYRDYWTAYHQLMRRQGVTPDLARAIIRTNTTAIAAMMLMIATTISSSMRVKPCSPLAFISVYSLSR